MCKMLDDVKVFSYSNNNKFLPRNDIVYDQFVIDHVYW